MRGSTRATGALDDRAPSAGEELDDGAIVKADAPVAPRFAVATHEALFSAVADAAARCDSCGEELVSSEDDEGFAVPGRGMYVWTRGDEVRREEVPLCAPCASAIGRAALARWEIEEEEG